MNNATDKATVAAETWSETTCYEASQAKEKAEANQPWAARQHASEAAKAAWLTEIAAMMAGDERSHNLARAAKMHADYAKQAAEDAEAQERWTAGHELLKAMAESATNGQALTADDREAIEAAQEYCEILEDDEDESDKWTPTKTAKALEQILAKTK